MARGGRSSSNSRSSGSGDRERERQDLVDSYYDTPRSGSPRSSSNHNEFYNFGHKHLHDDDDDDDESDYDSIDDEEQQPLCKGASRYTEGTSPIPKSDLLRSTEQCINRLLVICFIAMVFIFIRNHTPWWIEHVERQQQQQAILQNSILEGDHLQDDDDVVDAAIDRTMHFDDDDASLVDDDYIRLHTLTHMPP